MGYAIEWIGEVGLGVMSDGGRQIGMSLLEGQVVPAEFAVGDRVRMVNSPDQCYATGIVDENRGYYTLTHVRSGTTLTVWHKADEWRLERLPECEACRKARADGVRGNLSCSSEADKCRNSVKGKAAKLEAEQG
jgi:hypothetical protein